MDTPWAPVGALSIFPHVTSSPMRGTLSLDRMMVGSSASSVSSIRGEVAHLDTGHQTSQYYQYSQPLPGHLPECGDPHQVIDLHPLHKDSDEADNIIVVFIIIKTPSLT